MRMTYHFTRLLATAVIATLALLLGSPQFSFANNSWTGDHTTLRQEAAKLGIHVGSAVSFSALRWAHLADPHAKLFLNDYNIEGIGPKSNAMYPLVKSLKEQHVTIGGVGFETHLALQYPFPSMFRENLQRFADLGLQVDITEMDVRMVLPATPTLLATQASWYAEVMQDCIAVRACVDFTVWEFTDKYSWVPGTFPGQGAADIYDANFAPKPAYFALINALEHPVSRKQHDG